MVTRIPYDREEIEARKLLFPSTEDRFMNAAPEPQIQPFNVLPEMEGAFAPHNGCNHMDTEGKTLFGLNGRDSRHARSQKIKCTGCGAVRSVGLEEAEKYRKRAIETVMATEILARKEVMPGRREFDKVPAVTGTEEKSYPIEEACGYVSPRGVNPCGIVVTKYTRRHRCPKCQRQAKTDAQARYREKLC